MPQKNKIKLSIGIIITFCIALYVSKGLFGDLGISITDPALKATFFYGSWTIPTLLVTGFLFGFKNIIKELGLSKGFIQGLMVGLICVAPMLIGSFFLGTANEEAGFWKVLFKNGIRPGFFEEYFFRGFLFGLLFRKAKWGFIPAALLGAIIFGALHIYQGNTLMQTTGIFMITLMGGLLYAWLYIEWKENLWVPIWLHILMNFSWIYFEISDTGALGGISANIFRALTIFISIVLTIVYNIKKDRFRITSKNLFSNQVDSKN